MKATRKDTVIAESDDTVTNEGAAWYYPQPKAAASRIADRVAFWKGVEVKE